MALHRPAEFNKSHVPAFLADEEPRDYVCVYPFVRSYEWYLLPDEERRAMLAEHGQMARGFPDVRANTVASFALGDYEWMLAFEADELHRIVDLMRDLRGVAGPAARARGGAVLHRTPQAGRRARGGAAVTATPRSGDGHDVARTVPAVRDAWICTTAGVDRGRAARHCRAARSCSAGGPADRASCLGSALLYVMVDIFVQGPLTQLDLAFYHWHRARVGPRAAPLRPGSTTRSGSARCCVPILLVVAGVLARRHRTWRPLVLAVMSFLILNVVVGAMKIAHRPDRDRSTGDPSVLNGGVIFPSGHSSNMVLTGGVLVYLLLRYAEHPPVRRVVALWSVLTALTIATSLYLGSHWISDLIGGVLVGGLLLQAVIVFDRTTADVRDAPAGGAWRRRSALRPPRGERRPS